MLGLAAGIWSFENYCMWYTLAYYMDGSTSKKVGSWHGNKFYWWKYCLLIDPS